MTIRGGEYSIVENNVIDLGYAHPVSFKNYAGGVAKTFNNQKPSGALISGHDENANKPIPEFEKRTEDALMLLL